MTGVPLELMLIQAQRQLHRAGLTSLTLSWYTA